MYEFVIVMYEISFDDDGFGFRVEYIICYVYILVDLLRDFYRVLFAFVEEIVFDLCYIIESYLVVGDKFPVVDALVVDEYKI